MVGVGVGVSMGADGVGWLMWMGVDGCGWMVCRWVDGVCGVGGGGGSRRRERSGGRVGVWGDGGRYQRSMAWSVNRQSVK